MSLVIISVLQFLTLQAFTVYQMELWLSFILEGSCCWCFLYSSFPVYYISDLFLFHSCFFASVTHTLASNIYLVSWNVCFLMFLLIFLLYTSVLNKSSFLSKLLMQYFWFVLVNCYQCSDVIDVRLLWSTFSVPRLTNCATQKARKH